MRSTREAENATLDIFVGPMVILLGNSCLSYAKLTGHNNEEAE